MEVAPTVVRLRLAETFVIAREARDWEDVVQVGVGRVLPDPGDVVAAAGPAHADHLGAGRGQRRGHLAADAAEADERDAGARQHRGLAWLPAVPGLGAAQAGHIPATPSSSMRSRRSTSASSASRSCSSAARRTSTSSLKWSRIAIS